MKDKVFNKIIIAIMIIGMISTAALVAYTVYLHKNVSIITFIANE